MGKVRRAKPLSKAEERETFMTVACYKCEDLREYHTVSRNFFRTSRPRCRYCDHKLELVEHVQGNTVLISSKRAKKTFSELLRKWRER